MASERIQLERQRLQLTSCAYAAGVLNQPQFSELEGLQAEDPEFIASVAATFADETGQALAELRARLVDASPPDAAAARVCLHKLKGSALTLGAAALGVACEAVRARLIAGDTAAAADPNGGPGSLKALSASADEVMGAPAGARRRQCCRVKVAHSRARSNRHAATLHRRAAETHGAAGLRAGAGARCGRLVLC